MKTKKIERKVGYFQKRERNLMKWVGYWRKNPQIFVKDYLGINLKLYQKLLFYMMNKVDFFMYIAARGRILVQISRNTVWNGGIKLEA